jgi:galactokinase
MHLAEAVENKFKETFNEQPFIFRSPGRINLIGEHTDYNLGYVLPASIDKAMYFAVAPRNDKQCRLISIDLHESYEFSIDHLHSSPKQWANYLIGVVDQLIKGNYKLRGFNCVFGGDIPIGAGLSSSAAIESGLAYALDYIFHFEINRLQLVMLAQKAENDFVGVQCGIMDQYINIFGEPNTVLRIDCRALEHDYFPFEFPSVAIVLFDTQIPHALATSEYNQRRAECFEGLKIIQQHSNNIHSLRDINSQTLHMFKSVLNEKLYRRCKFVTEENERLLKACTALQDHDIETFGELMYKTHEGLSLEYEVSCEELDFLVSKAQYHSEVYGARMMGAGFGGCTINLIEKNAADEICLSIAEMYRQRFGTSLKIHRIEICGGTSLIEMNERVSV